MSCPDCGLTSLYSKTCRNCEVRKALGLEPRKMEDLIGA